MKLIVGNQKTYLDAEEINNFIKNTNDRKDVIICPSYVFIDKYVRDSKYTVGGQNETRKTDKL